jgi:hypothetical protein
MADSGALSIDPNQLSGLSGISGATSGLQVMNPGLQQVAGPPIDWSTVQFNNPSGGQVLGASTTNPSTGTLTSPGSNGQYAQNPALTNAINAKYDTVSGNLQNQLGLVQKNYNDQIPLLQGSFDSQGGVLQANRAAGDNALNQQQLGIDQEHNIGLRNLVQQTRGMINGYQNQLGVYGAADSSAAPMLNYALTNQGNQATNDLNQQYGLQNSNILQQHKDLGLSFDSQNQALQAQKQLALQQIADQFAQSQSSLQDAMKQAGADKAQYLAYYNPQAAQDALSKLQALDAQYGSAADLLQQNYNKVGGPAPLSNDLSQYQNFQATPLTPQQLAGANFDPASAAYQQQNNPITLNRRPYDPTQP